MSAIARLLVMHMYQKCCIKMTVVKFVGGWGREPLSIRVNLTRYFAPTQWPSTPKFVKTQPRTKGRGTKHDMYIDKWNHRGS